MTRRRKVLAALHEANRLPRLLCFLDSPPEHADCLVQAGDLRVTLLPPIVESSGNPSAIWLDAPEILVLGVAILHPVRLLLLVVVNFTVHRGDSLLEVSLLVNEVLPQRHRCVVFGIEGRRCCLVILLAV